MAPVQIRLVLSVFAMLLCGALINVHFFQSDTRGRVAARVSGKSAVIATIANKARTEEVREAGEQWQARLRRKSVSPGKKSGSKPVELAKADHTSPSQPSVEPGATETATGLPKDKKAPLALGNRRSASVAPERNPPKISKLVRAVQRELTSRGYEPGPVDGIDGLMTKAAIMAFQHDGKVSVTGLVSEALLRRLVLGGSSLSGRDTVSRRGVEVRKNVTKTVQVQLKKLGYNTGSANGLMSAPTVGAIKEFEKYSGLVPTGRISGRLIGKLSNTPRVVLGARM